MKDNDRITLVGEMTDIIYRNEDNGYTVAEFETENELYTIVGYLTGLNCGESARLSGKMVNHDVYGEQFKVDIYEKEIPKSIDAIYRYLSSGIIRGVREATANRIVEAFGEDSLDVIENDPLRLSSVRGISMDKAIKIQQSYLEQMGASALIMFLQNYDITVKMAAKIYKKLGIAAIERIKLNPYILCDEIDGIGFKTADKIAINMGLDYFDENRVRSGIIYTLKQYMAYGHTCVIRDYLVRSSAELLGIDVSIAEEVLSSLITDVLCVSKVINDTEYIYYYRYYLSERFVAKKLKELDSVRDNYNIDDIERQLMHIEAYEGIRYAAQQREAIINAMNYNVMIITGGPGTGKTTIINTIIKIMEQNGLKVMLSAPTGRAAKRMSQVCNRDAKTIHRLLEAKVTDDDEEMEFMIDEDSPINTDVLIVDEMSMVDIVLMSNLLKALRQGTKLIMVGDVNQLPSVGAGNVLKDMIDSECLKVIKLTEIFRQAEESMIVVNAHRINQGQYPVCNDKDKDFFFAHKSNANEGLSYILSLCKERLPAKYGISPYDIQVLSPVKRGVTGIENLNTHLQNELNPPSEDKNEKNFGDFTLREGDKVMQMKNNYNIVWTSLDNTGEGTGVFNGDVGVVTQINHVFESVTVAYDDKIVQYPFKDVIDNIDLAYAVTVHKSQGNEFPVVIMPMYDGPEMLINRNLFYTAVTRAKNLVVLVGSEDVMRKMVNNNKERMRWSGLSQEIKGFYV